MAKKKIAIVGAGAKAAAIAAKAHCLNLVCKSEIEITVFEQGPRPAQNWSGQAGYTDGHQYVCTPVERDLGFPYESVFGQAVNDLMQARFSWLAYAINSTELGYKDRINRGATRIKHSEFADYLRFAIERTAARIEYDFEVSSLTPVKQKWKIERDADGAKVPFADLFDAVVITGPGPAKTSFGDKTDPAVFDAESAWRNRAEIERILAASREDIIIAGGGGAAAALAAWLDSIDPMPLRPIVLIAKQATFYVRSGGYFENRVFDDDDVWSRLSLDQRREFTNRVTRAVVWASVADQLMKSNRIILEPGRAISFDRRKVSSANELWVTFTTAKDESIKRDSEAALIIDGGGFQKWWFLELLPAMKLKDLQKAADDMDSNLKLALPDLPPLHAPNVSEAIGPGFTSLMLLGRMADRILHDYWR